MREKRHGRNNRLRREKCDWSELKIVELNKRSCSNA